MSEQYFFIENQRKDEVQTQNKNPRNVMKSQKPPKTSFGIIHQNIQSIGNAVEQLEIFLQDHEDCKVLCLSEHWKTEEQLNNYSIPNFNLVSKFCREENKHGGCAIYVAEHLKNFHNKKNVGKISETGHIECAAVEGKVGDDRTVIINVYRPPNGDIKIFLEKIDKILSTLIHEKVTIFLVGDFNIDLLTPNKNMIEFISLLTSHNLQQTIFQNTRITPISQTCIDNIFTNCNNHNYEVQVIASKLSDHTAQKINIWNKVDCQYNSYRRSYTVRNKQLFREKLEDCCWSRIYEMKEEDVNSQWQEFYSKFLHLFDETFPKKKNKKKKKNLHQ